MRFNKFLNKLRIIFYLPLIAFLFCVKSAMPMATTSVMSAEQVNHIRQALLASLVAKLKNTIVTLIPIADTTGERQPLGDIYLEHNQHELVGTSSGHLIIIKNLQESFDKIKVHDRAVSCIAAKDEIVATGSCTCKEIHRWNINTFKMHDKIYCQEPIISMHIIENHFFVIDIQGNISLLDWKTGILLCKIETEILKPILNSKLDRRDGLIIIMAPKAKAFVKIDLLVKLDMLICSLKEEQLAQIAQIITLDFHSQDYSKIMYDANLPYPIKELLST